MKSKLFSDVKGFLGDSINRILLFEIVLCVLIAFFGFYLLKRIDNAENQILLSVQKAEKKVDFRYFNLTRSMEEIHNVKIDTYRGQLDKR